MMDKEIENNNNNNGNAFTPIAKRTVPGLIFGGCMGLTYAKVFGANVGEATVAGAAQGLAFSGVYFGCNTLLCWKQGIDPYTSNMSNHAISGALTGAVYRTLKKGITGSVLGSAIGAGVGTAFYVAQTEFEYWRDRERRRMLWQLEGGDDLEFMKREGMSNRMWNALTNLPSWFPIQFHDEENAAEPDRRADLRVKERLQSAYEGFEGPNLSPSTTSKDNEDHQQHTTAPQKSRKMRMHRPNTFIVAKLKKGEGDEEEKH